MSRSPSVNALHRLLGGLIAHGSLDFPGVLIPTVELFEIATKCMVLHPRISWDRDRYSAFKKLVACNVLYTIPNKKLFTGIHEGPRNRILESRTVLKGFTPFTTEWCEKVEALCRTLSVELAEEAISLNDEEDISAYLLDCDQRFDEEILDNSDASGSSPAWSEMISDIKRLWTQQQYSQSILLGNPVSANNNVQQKGDMLISAILSDETTTLADRLSMLNAQAFWV